MKAPGNARGQAFTTIDQALKGRNMPGGMPTLSSAWACGSESCNKTMAAPKTVWPCHPPKNRVEYCTIMLYLKSSYPSSRSFSMPIQEFKFSEYLGLVPEEYRLKSVQEVLQTRHGVECPNGEDRKHRTRKIIITSISTTLYVPTVVFLFFRDVRPHDIEPWIPMIILGLLFIIFSSIIYYTTLYFDPNESSKRKYTEDLDEASRHLREEYQQDAIDALKRKHGDTTEISIGDGVVVIAISGLLLLVNLNVDVVGLVSAKHVSSIDVRSVSSMNGSIVGSVDTKGSVLGNALAGAFLFGGTGAIVGAIAASAPSGTKSEIHLDEHRVWFLDIAMTLDDVPFIRIGPVEDEVALRSLVARFRQVRNTEV
jgi:hypothetical protein